MNKLCARLFIFLLLTATIPLARADDYSTTAKARMMSLLGDRKFLLSNFQKTETPICNNQQSCNAVISFLKDGDFDAIESQAITLESVESGEIKKLADKCPNVKTETRPKGYSKGIPGGFYKLTNSNGDFIYVIKSIIPTAEFKFHLQVGKVNYNNCILDGLSYITSKDGIRDDKYFSELIKHDDGYYVVTFVEFLDLNRPSFLAINYYGKDFDVGDSYVSFLGRSSVGNPITLFGFGAATTGK